MLLLLLGALACAPAPPAPSTDTRLPAPAPADLSPGPCADLAEVRVCWQGDTPQVVPRTTPGAPAAVSGWRCGGQGGSRVCEERARNGSPFTCGTQRCLQTQPRMPDDGEWDCVEISGVVYCHSRGPAAGMRDGPLDLGWICGSRSGTAALEGERICVDLDADRPSDARFQRCRYEPHFGAPQRSCTAASEPRAGSFCSSSDTCPRGTTCQREHCLPPAPRPSCWLDADCGEHAACLFGSCVGA
ncbi:MAG: hypothetical protein ABW321_26880 [Polyangiales bacterium]